jgi:type IV pilus assembly protein PilC
MPSKIADLYEDQVDAAATSLSSILEPVMLVVVGGIGGFIVISISMPLLKVYDQIRWHPLGAERAAGLIRARAGGTRASRG